ncbi:sentrin-specific protease 8-like [Xenia sp. Carnegie-2017]|uniref:sentrin-specific protease 8-like n=1 Tax=Xenia sp. Carnegie-2017 TaxID=2897299 RepID=UPI001F04DE7B|nr:sentrin-specific protease 8-like [Xenia sp. Carnegie-2017]
MADEIVLNFRDSLLRRSDVKLLDERQWLNDKIIGFMFEYFEYVQFEKLENAIFINPDVAQYIKLCEEGGLASFLEPLSLDKKKIIFLPVNSNTVPDAIGGDHWSLLVYDADKNAFKHYDSLATSNLDDARQISRALEPFLKAKTKIDFTDERCPQQLNTYDCGMYVVCITEELCKQLEDDTKCDAQVSVSGDFVTQNERTSKTH